MPPAVLTALTLSGQQIGEVVYLIGKLYKADELERLVRIKLDLDLFGAITSPKNPLEPIAYDLVTYLLRNGRVGEFLDAMVQSRPRDDSLRLFVGRVRGIGIASPGAQAEAFGSAIGAITEVVKANPVASQKVGESKARFEITRAELEQVAGYKALHDCLHTVQFQLSVVVRAARAFPADPSAGRDLKAYFNQLHRLAKRARLKTERLLTEAEEIEWVDDFDRALEAADRAVRESAPLTDALRALSRLLPEAARINLQMIGAARRLAPALDELTDTVDQLARQLVATGRPDAALARLVKGAEALHALIPQLAGLTLSHNTWQRIETALAAAEATPPARPADRVPKWEQIKKLLPNVCPPGSITDETADPVALAGEWEAEADPAAEAAENQFIALFTAARNEFKGVDDELLALADELIKTIAPLDALIQVI